MSKAKLEVESSVLKVGGIPHTVTLVSEMRDVNSVDDEKLFGEIRYSTAQIRVFSGGPIELTNRTLWHEILHAMILHYGICELRNDDGVDSESAIDRLATGICEVLDSRGLSLV